MFFLLLSRSLCFSFFFFNDTATTEIYTLSLHDALPILWCEPNEIVAASGGAVLLRVEALRRIGLFDADYFAYFEDRKSTRLNSSHVEISYAVFCLKKKKNETRK